MKKLKVLYVHGFGGSANGSSSKVVKEALEKNFEVELDAPQIPYMNPEEAISFIQSICSDYDFVFASSLGAFYTAQVGGCVKVLFNIAMPEDVYKVSGDKELFDKLVPIKEKWVEKLDNDFRYETYLIFGTKDELCNNLGWCMNNYWASNCFVGEYEHHLEPENVDSLATYLRALVEDHVVYKGFV